MTNDNKLTPGILRRSSQVYDKDQPGRPKKQGGLSGLAIPRTRTGIAGLDEILNGVVRDGMLIVPTIMVGTNPTGPTILHVQITQPLTRACA